LIGKRYKEEKKTGQTKKKEEKGATIAPLKTAQKIAEKKYYR
jgi:hypothetical protein